MTEQLDSVVVGGGQAGLAVSHELTQAGVEHVVLERGKVGQTWRGHWDSFCLVSPNWSVQLPGHPYDGAEPDGYMARDEVVAYLERYAWTSQAPVRERVDVASLQQANGSGFLLETSAGPITARTVVVCTGSYRRPNRPVAAAALPRDLLQIDVPDYRSPSDLPAGPVLVVGSGQSGCQIAEELLEAGREVFLSCGKAPWLPRRIGDRDLFWWAMETGFQDTPVGSLPDPTARLAGNVLATGRDGGHDLHLRVLRKKGVTLLGRFAGANGRGAEFAPDLHASVAWGDERQAQFMDLVRKLVAERGLPEPDMPPPEPFNGDAPEHVDLRGFGAVVFAGGFRPDLSSWVHCPGAFDELGFPIQEDGASTVTDGLYFAGVHFQRKRKSALLVGVGEDAAIVAGKVGSQCSGGG